MNWDRIIRAAHGRRTDLDAMLWFAENDEPALVAALTLLDDDPPPPAPLVMLAWIEDRMPSSPAADALAQRSGPALAAWCADPQWPNRVCGSAAWLRLIAAMPRCVAALRHDPAARACAIAIIERDGTIDETVRLLVDDVTDEAIDTPRITALIDRAAPFLPGPVWTALSDTRRAEIVRMVIGAPYQSAQLIGRIGAAAWKTTDAALRERLIASVVRSPALIDETAPAWTGMTPDERDCLTMSVITSPDAESAWRLLKRLGAAGRALLTPEQRAALDHAAMRVDPWGARCLRAADAPWRDLPQADRRTLLQMTRRAPLRGIAVLRAIGIAGWGMLRDDERALLRAAVADDPATVLCCPPEVWSVIAGARLPPAWSAPTYAPSHWRSEDAAARLDDVPPAHQTLVLALAPWRESDFTPTAQRMLRLIAAWNNTPFDERVVLTMTHPLTLPVVIAAMQAMRASPPLPALTDMLAAIAKRTDPNGVASSLVGALLHRTKRWRPWMCGFAPDSDNPSENRRSAWVRAARAGLVRDRGALLRLLAQGAPRRDLPWKR